MSNSNDKEQDNMDKDVSEKNSLDEVSSDIGYFLVIKNPNDEFDIQCQINEKATGKPPKEYIDLYNDIESASSIIKSLDKTSVEIKRKYFDKLLSLAQAGLVSSCANPELAGGALKKLKEEVIIVEGRRIKNGYMKRLGIVAIIISAISIIAFLIAHLGFDCKSEYLAFLLLGTGAMVGAWVSFGARKFKIQFEELSIIEKDQMEPIIRLLFIYLSTCIFALFMMTGILQIKIGNVDTKNFTTDYKVSLLVGSICGLVESRIGVKIYKHADNMVSK